MDEPEEVKRLKTELMKVEKEVLVSHLANTVPYFSIRILSDETIKSLQELTQMKKRRRKIDKLLSDDYLKKQINKRKNGRKRTRKIR